MKPSEIIIADAQSNGNDPQKTLDYILNSIQNRNGVLVQKNNSVLLLTPLGQNSAEWNLSTQDNGANLIDSIKYFINQIKKTDVSMIYGMVDNENVLQTINNFGLPTVKSDNPEYEWMARVK